MGNIDAPKHVELFIIINKLLHQVGISLQYHYIYWVCRLKKVKVPLCVRKVPSKTHPQFTLKAFYALFLACVYN